MTTKQLLKRISAPFAAILAATFLIVLAFAAGPPEDVLSLSHPKVKKVVAVQEAVTSHLMASMKDVIGTAIAQDDDGEVAMVIYVNLEGKNPGETVRNLPTSIAGARVTVEVTEPFRAMAKPSPKPTVSHTAKQTPPIQLGTSGGWGNDLANGYCCGGTLGSLVKIGEVQYVLSNYHVLEAHAEPGDLSSVIQPALIDVSCNAASAQAVATRTGIKSLPGSNVDAAIAQVIPYMVSTNGSILEIGTISASTIGAFINQAVKKSGRTTKLTRSKVSGLNATVSVAYDNECAGGEAFTKTFTGQIIVANRGSRFLAGGDSGSLMVEDVATNPRAVGLLFAGSSTLAVANPIGQVLLFFGATMVGN
jgi:hypothetical protein